MAAFYKDEYIEATYIVEKNVIKVTFSEIEPDEKLFAKYLKFLEDTYANKNKIILIYDSSKAKYLASDLRIKLGNWFKSNAEVVKKYNHHTVFIINSMMIRMVLNGIFLVEKPVYKYDIVGTFEEAQKIMNEKLKTIF
ncbi:MAG: hypothetical protein EAZ53_14595 [Bacteroidetes bacterium]|nr:MAG: hypothetical protein EAZ53_14595 [Bacteroidota bacterium]